MIEAVNDTLTEAKISSPRRNRIPDPFDEDEISAIHVIRDLLAPFADFTNNLQADGVSSSVVFLGAINAIKGMLRMPGCILCRMTDEI